jgi:dihydroorotase-like cyclic amidohydrolase
MIIRYRKDKNLSFETCPHYLHFISEDLPVLRGKLKTAPPVKHAEDRSFLRNALKTGLIDYVATDHAGCKYESEKEKEDFSKVYNGIPGTELLIPYLFSEFYQKEKVPLKKMIELTSENQAKRLGLFPRKGSLDIGTDADFTVIDPDKAFKVDEEKLHSRGKYSPWHDHSFSCRIEMTIIRGEMVYQNGKGLLVEPGFGRWIRRSM